MRLDHILLCDCKLTTFTAFSSSALLVMDIEVIASTKLPYFFVIVDHDH